MNIRERIQTRLDELASLLESQSHLHAPEIVAEKLDSIAKFWSALSEEEREFVLAARMTISESLYWRILDLRTK